MTEFVECLYVNYDFDRAQKKLLECDKVCMCYIINKFSDVAIKNFCCNVNHNTLVKLIM